MAKKNNVTALPVAKREPGLRIPQNVLDQLRKLRARAAAATTKLGQLRASYVGQEQALVREIGEAERAFTAAAKSALLACGQDPDADGTWDLDLAAGEIRRPA